MKTEDITVHYYVHEEDMARQDYTIRRLLRLLLITIILFFVTLTGLVAGFMIYESQFASESITVSQEAETLDGDNTLINNSGVLIDGTSETDSDS